MRRKNTSQPACRRSVQRCLYKGSGDGKTESVQRSYGCKYHSLHNSRAWPIKYIHLNCTNNRSVHCFINTTGIENVQNVPTWRTSSSVAYLKLAQLKFSLASLLKFGVCIWPSLRRAQMCNILHICKTCDVFKEIHWSIISTREITRLRQPMQTYWNQN